MKFQSTFRVPWHHSWSALGPGSSETCRGVLLSCQMVRFHDISPLSLGYVCARMCLKVKCKKTSCAGQDSSKAWRGVSPKFIAGRTKIPCFQLHLNVFYVFMYVSLGAPPFLLRSGSQEVVQHRYEHIWSTSAMFHWLKLHSRLSFTLDWLLFLAFQAWITAGCRDVNIYLFLLLKARAASTLCYQMQLKSASVQSRCRPF